MILFIDNYDSYVYNLVQYLTADGHEVLVRHNDEITVDEIRRADPDLLVISPGPGAPTQAGVCVPAIRELPPHIPIFGVCLGHQSIAHAFGATVRRARKPMHGRISTVLHDGDGVFAGLNRPVEVVRYHSLAVNPHTLPPQLRVTAWSEDGEVMGLRHLARPIESVQFHPESIFTPAGLQIVRNAARLASTRRKVALGGSEPTRAPTSAVPVSPTPAGAGLALRRHPGLVAA